MMTFPNWLASFYAIGLAAASLAEALLLALQMETVDFTQGTLPHFIDDAQAHHHQVNSKVHVSLGDLDTDALAREMYLPLFFSGNGQAACMPKLPSV